jgi:F-type H+-transporting ATPase subunit delta
VRQSIRGYADAVLETAQSQGRAAALAGELAGLLSLVRSSEDLRSVLSDPGLPAHTRRAVAEDLLRTKVSPEALRLISFSLSADRAPEALGNIEGLAGAAQAAAQSQTTEVELLGRTSANERIDGYASALLSGLRAESLSEVEDELFRFARAVEGSEALTAALTDRDVAAERRAGVVRDLLGGKASEVSTRLAGYAALWGRPRDYQASLDWLVSRVAAEGNRRVADVRSAIELQADQRRRLEAALGRVTGRPVQLRVSVDPDLLGGFVASVGDTVIDGSARHRLELVKERLSSAHADLLTGTGESL